MRSISTAIVQLDTYSAGLSADDMDRFRDELNRTLFFFCNLLGGLGLCIAYVIKRARDRNMSAVIQLSIKLLKALVKRCKAYGVKSSPFRASRSFLVTPVWQLVYQLEMNGGRPGGVLTHARKTFGIKATEITICGKQAELGIIQFE